MSERVISTCADVLLELRLRKLWMEHVMDQRRAFKEWVEEFKRQPVHLITDLGDHQTRDYAGEVEAARTNMHAVLTNP